MIGHTVGHYRIVRRLGEGGMGVVFEGTDTLLGRKVALKFLPTDVGGDEKAKTRFLLEARAASKLDHQNICAILEIGETEDGRTYMVMPFYDGESIEARLRRGAMPVSLAVDVASQVARGLRAAHRIGVVHRDIKPANVILTNEGVAKIIDFGIAKLKGLTLMDSAELEGSIHYMSPERIVGSGTSEATDLWGVGVLLYEMLTGVRPFESEQLQTTVHSIVNKEPAPLRTLRPDIDLRLQHVVSRLLRKDPRERFASADELLGQLERLKDSEVDVSGLSGLGAILARHKITLAAAAVALGLVAATYSLRTPGDEPAIRSVAVLPFENLSGSSEHEYLASGLHDAMISELTGLGSLRVTSRTSVMGYRGTNESVPDIARELGVDAIIEGSVLVENGDIAVTAQLIDGRTDRHLWSQTFEHDPATVLHLRKELASAIVKPLRLALTRQERVNLATPDKVDPRTYNLFLRARHHLGQFSPDHTRRALADLQDALDADPTYAPAWGALALAHAMSSSWTAGTNELPASCASAIEHSVRRALALDPDEATAHFASGWLEATYYWNWKPAEQQFRRAIELDPDDFLFRVGYAEFLSWIGRLEEAEEVAREAVRLAPSNPLALTELRIILDRHEQNTDEANSLLQRNLETNPDSFQVRMESQMPLVRMGHANEAVALAEALMREYPDNSEVLDQAAKTFLASGQVKRARAIVGQLERASVSTFISPVNLAVLAYSFGEYDKALDCLEKGAAVRDPRMTWLLAFKNDPRLEPTIRDDPRFITILERMGFDEADTTAYRSVE